MRETVLSFTLDAPGPSGWHTQDSEFSEGSSNWGEMHTGPLSAAEVKGLRQQDWTSSRVSTKELRDGRGPPGSEATPRKRNNEITSYPPGLLTTRQGVNF